MKARLSVSRLPFPRWLCLALACSIRLTSSPQLQSAAPLSPWCCLLSAGAAGRVLHWAWAHRFSQWGLHTDGLRSFCCFFLIWGLQSWPNSVFHFQSYVLRDQESMGSGERGQGTQGLVLATSPRKREKQTAGILGLHSRYLPPEPWPQWYLKIQNTSLATGM